MARNAFIAFDPDIAARGDLSIAHGACTNSKRTSSFVKGVYPTHLVRSKGAYTWDTRGNRYVDFITGLGSSLLGHGNEEVNQAIIEQLSRGITHSLSSELAVRVAEKVKELFPFVEQVRFLKSGTDACNASIRIARAYSGRSKVFSEGYHGWGDEFTSLTPPAVGVCPQPNIEKAAPELGEAAAMITEPIITDFSDRRRAYLMDLRKDCAEKKVPLIYDEVITGMRFPNYSVASYYGITPDLICLGKAVANGMPLSVVGGKKSVMECGDYFVSSTFAEESLSLAAALKTMTLLQNKYQIDWLWEKGAQFLYKFNHLWPDGVWIEGYPTRGAFKSHDPLVKALFFQEACKSGLLFGPSWFFNFTHIELMDQVLSLCKDILLRIRMGGVKLEGEMPALPYAMKVRNT